MIEVKCGHSHYQYQGQCRFCLRYLPELKNSKKRAKRSIYLDIPFPLTRFQEEVAIKLRESSSKEIFLEAVCGAGKTEICLFALKKQLEMGSFCAWVIPRREIVLDLTPRLQKYFPTLKVSALCEGHLDEKEADLLVMTSHQLYRYENYFDFMILDEPDAFPFVDNPTLNFFLKRSLKKQYQLVLLSATTHPKLATKSMEHLVLDIRPSLEMLPVPQWRVSIFWIFFFLKDLKKHHQEACLIYLPSIQKAKRWSYLLRSPMICSKTENKEEILAQFKEKKGVLVCTTILERGVTFKDCFCFVLEADHPVFNKSTLVQIAGRVKRGLKPKKGACYFYSKGKCEEVYKAITDIKLKNERAQSALKKWKMK